jgi:hypothetical protein
VHDRAQVQHRDREPSAAIRARTTMARFAEAVHDAWPALFQWMDDHGLAAAGAPFIRYLVIDPESELEAELAYLTAARGEG